MIRILIADDHDVVRRGLALVLGLEPGFVVAGEACSAAEAVHQAAALQPDVALLDLKMPGLDGQPGLGGSDAARALRSRAGGPRVIMLSGAEIDEAVLDLLEEVDGYVLKDATPAELAEAIRTVVAGQRYVHPGVAQAVAARAAVEAAARPRAGWPELSAREREVLRLMATAATYREIGQQLFIAEETVRSHAKNILAKLDQPNRTQAVMAAVRAGLLDLTSG